MADIASDWLKHFLSPFYSFSKNYIAPEVNNVVLALMFSVLIEQVWTIRIKSKLGILSWSLIEQDTFSSELRWKHVKKIYKINSKIIGKHFFILFENYYFLRFKNIINSLITYICICICMNTLKIPKLALIQREREHLLMVSVSRFEALNGGSANYIFLQVVPL